jgi:hypothetical protein
MIQIHEMILIRVRKRERPVTCLEICEIEPRESLLFQLPWKGKVTERIYHEVPIKANTAPYSAAPFQITAKFRDYHSTEPFI